MEVATLSAPNEANLVADDPDTEPFAGRDENPERASKPYCHCCPCRAAEFQPVAGLDLLCPGTDDDSIAGCAIGDVSRNFLP